MSEQTSMNTGGDIREQIREAIHHFEHLLPGQAPIKDFVHHNTLHGYQHLPFPEALAAARRLTGVSGYQPPETFREYFRQGRISTEDLVTSISEDTDLEADAVVMSAPSGDFTRRDVYLAALTMPEANISACQVNWEIEENNALRHLRADLPQSARVRLLAGGHAKGQVGEGEVVHDLWATCLQVLSIEQNPLHPEELFDLTPERAEVMLQQMLVDAERDHGSVGSTDKLMERSANKRLDALLDRVGRDYTLRDVMRDVTGDDLLDEFRPYMVRQMANFLDQGLAAWRPERGNEGFYAYWRFHAENDLNWNLQQVEGWQQHIELLDTDPLDTIVSELYRLGLPRERWVSYLEHLALELPGWSGMMLWRHNHAAYESLTAQVDMLDYLAVRLVLERIYAHAQCAHHFGIEASLDMLRWYFHRHPDEFTVRDSLYNMRLPEYLASRAQRAVRMPHHGRTTDERGSRWLYLAELIWTWRHSVCGKGESGVGACSRAWPLFQLSQQMGWSAKEVSGLTPEQIEMVFDCLARLDPDKAGYLWLQAYEKHYREQILAALAQNRGRGPWATREDRPAAQLVFCMDDREEGIRRHIEEISPDVETLGAAAHFNVPHNWRGLDDVRSVALAPVIPAPVIPAHDVCEVPADVDKAAGELHLKRHRWLQRVQEFALQDSRRGLLMPMVVTAVAAPAALGVLAGKVLAPLGFGRWLDKARSVYEKPVLTRMEFVAANDSVEATPEKPRLGFTAAEQADRVAMLLQSIGLQRGFSRLVCIIGHGSRNQNNPHASAYNCGACAGRFSGPNARLVSAMANRPEVRKILRGRGIHISSDTWFVGGEHDTCDDTIKWYDLDAMPGILAKEAVTLFQDLQQACQRHAQERCRRFASAPSAPSPEKAHVHVAGRALDFSQARPELGHATNACAFFGRRSISRGAFFDRRAFLISYDATQDPEGEVLERHLLINGAVGAGISLEYYFSTANNEGYGCGSKVMHNVTGFLGVMEGASSDLRTGLPQQMIEIHEAMRLLVVVEAKTDVLSRIYERQPPIQEIVGNVWIQLVSLDPDDGAINLFGPGMGWVPWQDKGARLQRVAESAEWYAGSRDPLPPVLLKRHREARSDA